MTSAFFQNTFKNIQTPVIICLQDESRQYPLVFANSSAKILLNPLLAINTLKKHKDAEKLDEILRFADENTFGQLRKALLSLGSVSQYATKVVNFEGEVLPISVSANRVEFEEQAYFIFYLYENVQSESLSMTDVNNVISVILHAAYHTADINQAINEILGIVGSQVRVSRVYIFEDLHNGYTRNTYEWCSESVEPAIQDLQNLKKEDYNYDAIVSGAMYITNDIRELPEQDWEILDQQGIKSLAILPLFRADEAVGYIGLDDCAKTRKWTRVEIQLLKQITNVVVSLLERRNAEEKSRLSLGVLRTITDHIDNIIYVSDIHTHEIIFVNNYLASLHGVNSNELVGKKCWATLQKGMDGPCEFCPVLKMADPEGNILEPRLTWEFQNTINGKWYLVRDAIIKWIDGRDVHIETATDITGQKKHEEQLQYFASIDTMTGAYNREWGYKMMQEILAEMALNEETAPVSLCFVDLDGLKAINDTFGHDAGDTMIIQVIDTIRSCTRKSDIICRWGGDEFIVIVRCGTTVAGQLMNRAQQALDRRNEAHKTPYRLAFSYGVISLNQEADKPIDTIISLADSLMYDQKTKKLERLDSQ